MAPKSVSIAKLFSYADGKDKAYMAGGVIFALLSGANNPAQLIVFGSVIDAFSPSATLEDSRDVVTRLAVIYCLVGLWMLVSATCQTACFTITSGRQTKRLREAHFDALLRHNGKFLAHAKPHAKPHAILAPDATPISKSTSDAHATPRTLRSRLLRRARRRRAIKWRDGELVADPGGYGREAGPWDPV